MYRARNGSETGLAIREKGEKFPTSFLTTTEGRVFYFILSGSFRFPLSV